MGTNFEFEVIVAAILGGVSLAGGKGTVLGVCVGAAIVGVINNALDLLNVQPYWQEIVEGLILVVVVAVDVLVKIETGRTPWLAKVLGKRVRTPSDGEVAKIEGTSPSGGQPLRFRRRLAPLPTPGGQQPPESKRTADQITNERSEE